MKRKLVSTEKFVAAVAVDMPAVEYGSIRGAIAEAIRPDDDDEEPERAGND